MKKWETPELSNLTVANTNEETCYCAEGEALAALTGERKHGGGHPHRPPHNNGNCPPTPCPPNNGGGDTGDTVIPQS
ncbi:hypothetical protein [Turicibacter sanguinis]|uniref:hypothetical protein n=1 Tax=Turicibacter sanguinis TaxID=154288 RepID=UPI0011CA3041|nr:hypothetical protein [Turicibacter sanguinis]